MVFPDLPFLTSFLAVYEHGTVTAASAQLARTQPTVSYQLEQLEQALQSPLFIRDRGRLVATDFAQRLYRLATGFARDFATIRHAPSQAQPLSVAAVSGFGRYVLFPLLEQLRLEQLTLRFPADDEVFRRVADGQVDLGFSFGSGSHVNVKLTPVYVERLVLVASPGRARTLRDRRDLSNVDMVTYDECEYVFGRWFGFHFGKRVPLWSSVAHFEELEEVMAAVADDRGVSVVPDFLVTARRWKVKVVDWRRPAVENTVVAVVRAGAPEHSSVNAVLQALSKLQTLRPLNEAR
jgi:LysR family transcriptional regulator, cyn operon transcriptional activator